MNRKTKIAVAAGVTALGTAAVLWRRHQELALFGYGPECVVCGHGKDYHLGADSTGPCWFNADYRGDDLSENEPRCRCPEFGELRRRVR